MLPLNNRFTRVAGLAAWGLPLAAALIVRLLLWDNLPRIGMISDEGEYLSAATWLAQGRNFSWYQGYLWTRAPIYPLFVAAHLRAAESLTPIYVSQTLLSLLNVLLVFLLARLLAPGPSRLIPAIAALLMAVYLPFAIYTQVLLSETLYLTLLLCGFLALGCWIRTRMPWLPALAGVLLGLATLTRGLTLGFLPLAALWLLIADQPAGRRLIMPTLVFSICAGLTIAPWTIYNSRMYGGLVVIDTSGAFNLLLGARTSYDGKRSDAPPRNFVLGMFREQSGQSLDTCAPYPGKLPSQAARQAAMTTEGLCLVAARPLAFVQKSLAELIDLFQINYTGAERFSSGFALGRLPPWYALALFLLDDTLYVLALPLALLGWMLVRTTSVQASRALSGLIGLWWLYNIAVAPMLFAINRFRLTLLPFAFIFAAIALIGWPRILPAIRSRYGAACTILASLLLLVATAPYAYLEPRAEGTGSRWASYLGPFPSSLVSTWLALEARPRYLADQQFRQALQNHDGATAAQILQNRAANPDTIRLGPALLAAAQGRFAEGLAALPAPQVISRDRDTLASVLRGDLLRSQGDEAGARAAFTPEFVDSSNPVRWAWEWLQPAPTRRIDLGGNLDLGYILGCYLGENRPNVDNATFRWCTDGTQLRFPAAGTGAPQKLVLRLDGRGWNGFATRPPRLTVWLGDQIAGTIDPTLEVGEYMLELPASPAGAEIVLTLHSATFVPDAARYLSQQGASVVGQVQRLSMRIDWVELREP